MRLLLIITLLFCPALALADAENDDRMRLSVKPILCITDRRTPACDMSFLVIWETGKSGYYCLFSDFDEAPVRCWNEQVAGRHDDDRTVETSFSYWMTNSNHKLRLAQVDVEVLRMDSDDRRRRRRTRHVWDIN